MQSYTRTDSRLSSNTNIHGSGFERERERERQTDRQTETETDRETDRETERQRQRQRQTEFSATDRQRRETEKGGGGGLDFCVHGYPPRKPNNRVVQAVS